MKTARVRWQNCRAGSEGMQNEETEDEDGAEV